MTRHQPDPPRLPQGQRRARRQLLARGPCSRPPSPTTATAKTVAPDEVDGFLAIDAQGAVTVYSGKVDLGTGVRTALTQIAAEELDVPMARVSVIQGDTALTPDQGITYGSLSIQNGGMQLRQAAATARRALLQRSGRRASACRPTISASRMARSAPKSGKTRLLWRADRRPAISR